MSSDKSAIDADKGSIGQKFQPDGSIGGKAQEVGGPFDKEGAIVSISCTLTRLESDQSRANNSPRMVPSEAPARM